MKPSSRINNYFIRDRSQEELPWLRLEDLRTTDLPRPVVLVNGGFDLLHASHMRLIFQARRRAKTLICALDADERVGRKGSPHPVLSWVERATALSYMPIDYLVEISSDRDMYNLIRAIRPDLRVQGAEYRGNDIPHERGVRYRSFVRPTGMRTSEIIRRIQERSDGSECTNDKQ